MPARRTDIGQAIWMVIVMKCSTVEYVLLKRRHDIRVGISDANGLSPDDARKIPICLGIFARARM